MRFGFACVSLALGLHGVGYAQQPETSRPTFRGGVSLVEVAAVVIDGAGRAVGDLTAADFEVREDGQPRPLASVRRVAAGHRQPRPYAAQLREARVESVATNVGVADAPAFVLVLDDLNTSPYDTHRVIRAGLGVLGAIPPDALVAVVTTSGASGSLLTLSAPGPEHASQVKEFRGRVLLTGGKPPPGFVYMVKSAGAEVGSTVDAPCGSVTVDRLQSQDCGDPTRAARRAGVIESVAQLLSRAGSRRKVLFWVTEDMGASPLDPHGNQASQRAMLQRVLDADVAVYPVNPREGHVDVRSAADIQEGDRGDNRPDRRTGGRVRFGPGEGALGSRGGTTLELNTDDMAAVTLDQVARESGGRWITNANDLERVLADVVTQNATAYLLAFESASAQVPGRHQIDVRVRREGARVFARRGYVVPDVSSEAHTAERESSSAVLQDVLGGTVAQGQIAIQVQVVPEFVSDRETRALVTVDVDPASAAGAPVDLLVLGLAGDATVSSQSMFRLTPPVARETAPWMVTVPIALPAGRGEVRVAAVTQDGRRSGLVIAPVEMVKPGKDLLMAQPVLLESLRDGERTPTLERTLALGTPIGLQVDVAGRPVRDGRVTVTAALLDVHGGRVRDADVVLGAGARRDLARATAELATEDLAPGEYVLVIEASERGGTGIARHAIPLALRAAHAAEAAPAAAAETSDASALVAPFSTLSVAHGPSTRDPQSGARVIRDRAAWEDFWLQLPTRQAAPDIDFGRATLLAFVVDGAASEARRPVVHRVERDGDAAVVYWHVQSTPASAVGHEEGSRPFAVVALVGHEGPIRFHLIEQ